MKRAPGLRAVIVPRLAPLAACLTLVAGFHACVRTDAVPVLTADMPLHLEDHLDAAVIEGSELPTDALQSVEWRFDEPQPDWKAIVDALATTMARVERTTDALRVTLAERTNGQFRGGVYVELPDWHEGEWTQLIVRARTSSNVRNIGIGRNQAEIDPGEPLAAPLNRLLGGSPVVSDGLVHTYQIRLRAPGRGIPWQRLGVWVQGDEPGSLDILSVSVVPTAALYAGEPAAVWRVSVGAEVLRQTLVTHAPGSITYRVRVPEGGRLDAALGVLSDDVPIEFRIVAESRGGQPATLLRETYVDAAHWAERSVDLSRFAGQTITLALETDSERPGAVAFFGAPTLSGVRATDKPNIIFYIIDGGSAEYMSLYGYNRRTTPNLERLATEGAVFERAYSNASWTRPSTVSFLTSLQHSVLGGLRNGANPVPQQVSTLAEHLRRAGYQTAELTSNPNAGRVNNLDRGNDAFRDVGVQPTAVSSVALHENFWQWRAAFPGEPYWVHFQTTDVHSPHYPVPPFAGLFISADRRQTLDEWDERLSEAWGVDSDSQFTQDEEVYFDRAGVDRVDYFTALRDLHDETMAHQDYQLGQLVARLKAQGEWERTLLIVAADHGVWAGSDDYGALMMDSLPSYYMWDDKPIVAPGVSHIPMLFVWPGRIRPGQRFSDPVSMIDMLPTILDLVDLPMPELMQGQSLAPLLRSEGGWEPRSVIFDEFAVDSETGEFGGYIEVIDGRWAASLEVNGGFEGRPGRPVPLLLYDLWNDPMCLRSLHEEHPDLVEKYTKLLEEQFAANLALGRHLTPLEAAPLTPEQLETLRSLGYIR